MKFKIHRGTKEIGGSCVEVWTNSTRILIDFGMPLVEKDSTEFRFSNYKDLSASDLISKGILPNVNGLNDSSTKLIDGVIISHAHQDHYGLINFINKEVMYYLGEATHKIIELNNIFTPQNIQLKNTTYFEKSKTFKIGDISITPYWVDHSAFDSYSFLIESNGKRIFYSGDFRSHGRKSKVFYWFSRHAPQNVDYLLLEGTTIGRANKPFKSEDDIENELVELFKHDKINLIYTSGQNIDRLTSIYRSCIKTSKIFVVDVYIAKVLKELSKFASIPYPSKKFENIRVVFPYYTSKKLKNEGHENILYQFKKYKITKNEIDELHSKIVMTVRPSMQKDLEKLRVIDNGNLIYSMWEGYIDKPDTNKFINYLKKRGFNIYSIHTSGHADTITLKKMVAAVKPNYIVPIHTFKGDIYKDIFNEPILELKDGETRFITDNIKPMIKRNIPLGTNYKLDYEKLHWLFGVEGGGFYFATKGNKYYLITDFGTLAEFSDEEDLESLISEYEFTNKKDCLSFIKKNIKDAKREISDITFPKELM